MVLIRDAEGPQINLFLNPDLSNYGQLQDMYERLTAYGEKIFVLNSGDFHEAWIDVSAVFKGNKEVKGVLEARLEHYRLKKEM